MTEEPAQIAPDGDAEILTPGVSTGFTAIVTAFDVVVKGFTQVAFDVITQLMTSLFARPPFT